jgi:hypothetical protein
LPSTKTGVTDAALAAAGTAMSAPAATSGATARRGSLICFMVGLTVIRPTRFRHRRQT